MKTTARLAVIVLGLLAAGGVFAQEDGYRLGVQDRVRIHVHEWPILTGEFAVGADGKVTLPMIGDVPTVGLLTSELAGRIADRLKTKAQLLELPETAVAIAQYRPFYILGGVERPGEYAYRPGMVVLNAVTIAGGVYRPPRTSDWGFERDSITGRGELRTVMLRREELKAKEWRLRAEIGAQDTLPDPGGTGSSARFMTEERSLFQARLDRHHNQLSALDDTISLLDREIVALQAQIAAAGQQKDSVARELEDTRVLISRGLAPAPRILPLERTLAQIQREQKEIETSILRARQQINLNRIQKTGLIDERRSTALTELQALLVLVKELDERFETASRLIAGSMQMSSAPAAEADGEAAPALTFAVVRQVGEEMRELPVTETTRLLPGDILKVFRPQETQPSRPGQRQGLGSTSEPGAMNRLGALR